MSLIYHSGIGYSEDLCEDITSWFLNTFCPNDSVEVEVVHGDMDDDCNGMCDYEGDTFIIELNSNMDRELYAKTLLHELTHMKQFIDGYLKLKGGKLFYFDQPISQWDYDDQPHEIVAREQESILLDWWICDTGDVTPEQVAHWTPIPSV